MSAVMKSDLAAQRQAFYEGILKKSSTPLWEVLHNLVTPVPKTPLVPYLWKWADMWPEIQTACQLITAQEAERRVLILENPGLPGHSGITPSLYAGLQLILPGEVAPSHRHTQCALRFVIEGDPSGRTYVCADTGSAVHGLHRDIWFMSNRDGWSWQQSVGEQAVIRIVQ